VAIALLHDADDPPRIDSDVRLADALQGIVDPNRQPSGRRRQHHDVRHLAQSPGVAVVHLDDDTRGALQQRGGDANRRGQMNPAVGRDVRRFDDRDVHRAEEPLDQRLRHVRQMHVDEVDLACVDGLPQGHGGLVRRPPGDRLRRRQRVVDGLAGRRARQDFQAERLPARVHLRGTTAERGRHDLRRARGRESAEPDERVVANQRGGFFCSQLRE
jgi:hypothetical protein